MFFNPKIAGGAVLIVGLGSFSYLWFRKQCSFEKTNHIYKSSLNISESILDCKEGNRDYSVFLVLKEKSESSSQDTLSFQVVDNRNGKVIKWGPRAEVNQQWTDWGISIYKDNSQSVAGENFGAEIRVPRVGRVYKQPWTTILIPCQKSHLKLKSDWNTDCADCGGRLLKSAKMNFEIQDNNNVKITNVFDWKDNFQPKRIFCSR